MSISFKCLLVFILALIYSIPAHSSDYSVTSRLEQIIDAQAIDTIHIHCYCRSGFVRRTSTNNEFMLKVIGTMDSVGYHGSQSIPKEVPKELLSFKETRNSSFLKLASREFTFIHHAYMIDSLEIIVPDKTKVILLRLDRRELEGRYAN